MPILTNHEVAELRKMAAFACRLLDLLEDVQTECERGFEDPAMMTRKRFDIAASMEIKIPLEIP